MIIWNGSPTVLRAGWVAAIFAGTFLALTPTHTAHAQSQEVPRPGYFLAMGEFAAGDYDDAGAGFEQSLKGAIKKPPQIRWIDSIAYYTMLGECYYNKGRYKEALDMYNAALNLYATYSDWMVSVQFPPTIRPAPAGQISYAPWGRSTRGAKIGDYRRTYSIQQGEINAVNNALRRGGAVAQAKLFPVNVVELNRTTALAIRRRRELLGPTGRFDPLTGTLIAKLLGPVTTPNHWSRAWADVLLGLAYATGGKEAQAKNMLLRGMLAGGQFDHPLTATALFELGRIELSAGNFDQAAGYFAEASYSAYQYSDPVVLEESLRYGQVTHLIANKQGPYPPLAKAMAWSRTKRLNHVYASLTVATAENFAVLGNSKGAAAALADANRVFSRNKSLAVSNVGARFNFTTAMVSYMEGRPDVGDAALNEALAYQKKGGSLWLHHISLAKKLALNGELSGRETFAVLDSLLRDPTAADWLSNPLESLSALVTPHPETYEIWFNVALGLKRHEAALQIADLARRHRFYSSLQFGGRLLSLRWVLEAPDTALPKEALLHRQDLLAHYPRYTALKKQADDVQEELKQLPLLAGDADQSKRQEALFGQLAGIHAQQEALLRLMAVRRFSASMVFPPKRSVKELQEKLPANAAALIFFHSHSRNHFYGFLLSKKEFSIWDVGPAGLLQPKIEALLREMGNLDGNRAVPHKTLTSDKWRALSRDLASDLLKANVTLSPETEELVIVPDGWLWYLPFEALGTSDKGTLDSWITQVRIRYAPTAGLIVGEDRGRLQNPVTAVALGSLYPRDDTEVAEAAYQDLAQRVPGTLEMRKEAKLPVASSLMTGLVDRLVVYDDIVPVGPYAWAPIPSDKAAAPLAAWLSLPWKGPEEVILPGFHTPAENSFKKMNIVPGSDMFLSVCGLMASGARTVLISRWRTAGLTSYELIREFTQELAHTSPADAWQRSVLLSTEAQLQPDREPRVQIPGGVKPPKAEHPFFWSSYLVVDAARPAGDDDAAAEADPKAEEKRKLLERLKKAGGVD